jgi:predicted RNA-binding protein
MNQRWEQLRKHSEAWLYIYTLILVSYTELHKNVADVYYTSTKGGFTRRQYEGNSSVQVTWLRFFRGKRPGSVVYT